MGCGASGLVVTALIVRPLCPQTIYAFVTLLLLSVTRRDILVITLLVYRHLDPGTLPSAIAVKLGDTIYENPATGASPVHMTRLETFWTVLLRTWGKGCGGGVAWGHVWALRLSSNNRLHYLNLSFPNCQRWTTIPVLWVLRGLREAVFARGLADSLARRVRGRLAAVTLLSLMIHSTLQGGVWALEASCLGFLPDVGPCVLRASVSHLCSGDALSTSCEGQMRWFR